MNTNILVVDDEPSVGYAVRTILEHSGLGVTQVTSGRECLDTLSAGFQGVILMDVMMPEMDGWQTIRAIVDRNLLGNSVICMMTALPDPEPEMEGVKEYVLDYLRKPFKKEEILATVAPLLELIPEADGD